MSYSILLMTAMSLGGAPDAPAPAPAVYADACCQTDSCCYERRCCGHGFLHGLKSKLSSWGHHGCGSCCETTYCKPTCNYYQSCCPCPTYVRQDCCGHDKCCGKKHFFGLGRLFHKHHRCDPCCDQGYGYGYPVQPAHPAPAPAPEPIKAPPMPKAASNVTSAPLPLPGSDVTGEETKSGPSGFTAFATTTELKREYLAKVGRNDDYTRITGQLFFVHADGGLWVVRYGTIDQDDRFGGSVVLSKSVDMTNYREGDLLTIQGEVIDGSRASKFLGAPLFRADSVDLVDRSE